MGGTRTTPTSSWIQNILMLITWLAGILLLVFVASRITDQLVAIALTIAVLGTCWTVTIRIMRRPAGPQRVEITNYEGLRGSFRIHQIGLYILLVPAILLSKVVLQLLGEQSLPQPGPQLLIAVGILVAIGGPLVLIIGRVHRFRVDETGQLWVAHWGREEPLHIHEFTQVRGSVVHGRRSIIPSKVVCSGGSGRLRRVVFTLEHIFARDQRTQVRAGILDAFLQDACEQAGYTVRSVGERGKQGWIASAQMRGQNEDR